MSLRKAKSGRCVSFSFSLVLSTNKSSAMKKFKSKRTYNTGVVLEQDFGVVREVEGRKENEGGAKDGGGS
jgi:hypothetical protein